MLVITCGVGFIALGPPGRHPAERAPSVRIAPSWPSASVRPGSCGIRAGKQCIRRRSHQIPGAVCDRLPSDPGGTDCRHPDNLPSASTWALSRPYISRGEGCPTAAPGPVWWAALATYSSQPCAATRGFRSEAGGGRDYPSGRLVDVPVIGLGLSRRAKIKPDKDAGEVVAALRPSRGHSQAPICSRRGRPKTSSGASTSGSARRPCWPAPCGRCRPCA